MRMLAAVAVMVAIQADGILGLTIPPAVVLQADRLIQ
jgi:hypothetical protein